MKNFHKINFKKMIDISQAKLEYLCIHRVGNKNNGDDLILSQSPISISDEKLSKALHKYFIQHFSVHELYSFTFSNEDYTLNPIFNYTLGVFSMPNTILKNSVDIAKHLYESSTHPQIKKGDLFVAYFTNIRVGEKTTEALGIFKAENKAPFMKVEHERELFQVYYDKGIHLNKLDKGCFVINSDRENGFQVCIVDNPTKTTETQYWRNTFLNIKAKSDEFHKTSAILQLTKSFITNDLTEEMFEDRTEQIDLLNRSVDYFKNNENFDKDDFMQNVFEEEKLIDAFKGFDKVYSQDNEITINDNFNISAQAVKKYSNVFKSVLKLDKNFHIYIHGDKDLIERGVDEDGRKFYKIYFEEES